MHEQMKIRTIAIVSLAALCLSGFVHAASEPVSAKELADWSKAGKTKRQLFQRFISASYTRLVDSEQICLPTNRPKAANRDAAFLAIQAGIDGGLFDEEVSAADAVKDSLGFWFPCGRR